MIMMIKAEQIIPILFFFYFNMGVTSFSLHKNIHTQTTASPSILITWVCYLAITHIVDEYVKSKSSCLAVNGQRSQMAAFWLPSQHTITSRTKTWAYVLKVGPFIVLMLSIIPFALKAVIHIELNNFKNPSEILQRWRKLVLLLWSLFHCGCLWFSWKVNREKFAQMITIDYSVWYSHVMKSWGN